MALREGWSLKRRFVRARTNTTAAVRAAGDAYCMTVENVSASGALLTGSCAFRLGDLVELELTLDGQSFTGLHARVVRHEPRRQGVAVAVEFKDVPLEVEEALAAKVMSIIEHARARSPAAVVIAAAQAADVRGLAQSVKACGLEPLFAATFLDALRWLQDPQVNVETFVVDLSLDEGIGPEALRWCAEAFPRVRRVLMATVTDASDVIATHMTTPPNAVLVRPIEPRKVPVALGFSSSPVLVPTTPTSLPPAA